jgi:hypothetical protein
MSITAFRDTAHKLAASTQGKSVAALAEAAFEKALANRALTRKQRMLTRRFPSAPEPKLGSPSILARAKRL